MRFTKLHRSLVLFFSGLGFFFLYTRVTLEVNQHQHLSTAQHFKEEQTADSYTVLSANEKRALFKVEAKLAVDKTSMWEFCQKNDKAFVWNTGKPLRILLVTTWRSGSTFLGNVLANHLATFYYYEPLIVFANQTTNDSVAEQAVDDLRALFHCRMPPRYMSAYRDAPLFYVSKNIGIWESCSSKSEPQLDTCKSRIFLEQSCKKFPIQVAKAVRLRLHLTESLLNDPLLEGLKVIYLVRDPRGTMNSRWKVSTVLKQSWCATKPDCSSPERLCSFMESDLSAYERLSKIYPDRLMMVKYEDIALNPIMMTQKIFNFSGLHYTDEVQSLVSQLTSNDDVNSPGGIQKKSKERAHMWKKDLTPDQVAVVERSCMRVVDILGYES